MNVEGWDIGTLGELCGIAIGGTPSRNNPIYWDAEKATDNLWVSIRDLNQMIITETSEYLTEQGVKNSNVKKIKKGTILLSFKLTIGRVAFAGKDLYTNEAIAGLETNKIASDFLYYGLQQWDLLQGVDQAIKGATLNKQKLNKIQFYYPVSTKEQEQIAAILSTIDRAIAQTEAIIAKQQRIKTGLMQDLLTKGIDEHGNIRSEATHEFKDSAIGRIPVEWEVKPLHKLTSYVVDCPHTTPNFLEGGVLVARTFNIKDGNFDLDNASFISESEYVQRISRLEPQPRDLIFTREAPVGQAFIVPEGMRVCLGQRTMLIRCDETFLNPNYLLENLYSQDIQMCFDRMVGGTTNPHLNVADVRCLPIKQPNLQEQINIVVTLTKIRLSLATTQRYKDQLQAVKTGLMQDLLTGKIRVTELLKEREAANP